MVNRKAIIEKTKQMFIDKYPELADPEFRKRLSGMEKAQLVAEMVTIAQKLEILNS